MNPNPVDGAGAAVAVAVPNPPPGTVVEDGEVMDGAGVLPKVNGFGALLMIVVLDDAVFDPNWNVLPNPLDAGIEVAFVAVVVDVVAEDPNENTPGVDCDAAVVVLVVGVLLSPMSISSPADANVTVSLARFAGGTPAATELAKLNTGLVPLELAVDVFVDPKAINEFEEAVDALTSFFSVVVLAPKVNGAGIVVAGVVVVVEAVETAAESTETSGFLSLPAGTPEDPNVNVVLTGSSFFSPKLTLLVPNENAGLSSFFCSGTVVEEPNENANGLVAVVVAVAVVAAVMAVVSSFFSTDEAGVDDPNVNAATPDFEPTSPKLVSASVLVVAMVAVVEVVAGIVLEAPLFIAPSITC